MGIAQSVYSCLCSLFWGMLRPNAGKLQLYCHRKTAEMSS